MKNLSKKIVAIALMLGSLSIYSCKKETGPKGDPGADGNANVTQINFGSKTLPANGGTLILTLPGITKSIADKSVILTYGLIAQTWFSLSGEWTNNFNTKTYLTLILSQDPASSVIFQQRTGPATSETFEAIRVLVIPANVLVNGRSATPPFDINDYESVRQYFNLPK